ncbi:Phosphomethylethanolamine N-methyltransferase 2 [Pleurostoma richardsiae]|uniref:Phosphomethylethanolamine N-methyltransferase 2 n=1 Tax=Pleurostoma richardsiae TaxID=41990 RepID=A0AA38RYV3_9PEZI|nr:Phosphomethylethanolamine N-methyltransferase 2 [Pleurostoma richardsiae]
MSTEPTSAGPGAESGLPIPPTGSIGQDSIVAEEQQDDENDTDSSLGDDAASSTASITSSILRYRTIHGRTYHSEKGNAQYWASNDQAQSESLDINHHVDNLLLGGKLYLAPLKKENVKKAVDIGTGTGIWAIDFADEFPGAEVIGTDISPIQPTWVPPNLTFEIEDCTEEWTFAPESLDYIHTRWLLGSVVDWTAFFREAYRCLRPGGYLESQESSALMESDDGSVVDGSAMSQWGKFFLEGGKVLGRSFSVIQDDLQRKAMEEAGFVDIQVYNFKTPIGSWPKDPAQKEIGQYSRLVLETDAEGYVLFMANTLGWSKEEVTVYIAELRREIRSSKIHGYYRKRVVVGRKAAVG